MQQAAQAGRLERTGICNWRNAIEVTPNGALATKGNATSFPGIYILDAKGVIRHCGLRDEQLEVAVPARLADAKTR